jgi:hypothetical protein
MAGEDRYAKSPKVEHGKVKRPEDTGMAKAKETAGSPPTAEDPKGAIKGEDDGPAPKGDETPMGGEVAKRHGGEMKDMLARHKTEHEQMIGRHHEEHGKMQSRHQKEMMDTSAPDKDESGAAKKVDEAVAAKPKELGEQRAEGKKGSEP